MTGTFKKQKAPPPDPGGGALGGGLHVAVGKLHPPGAGADVGTILLQMGLDVEDGEPLHIHQGQDAFGGGLLRRFQLADSLHKPRVQLRGPPA